MASQPTTYEVLKAESRRLRSFADRLDQLAAELLTTNGAPTLIQTPHHGTPALAGLGEYQGMTQPEAVLKALRLGPQTTRELFTRLNAGGQNFAKVSYVTAVLHRVKDKIQRVENRKVKLVESK